jgi:hypothetical protein
MRPSYRFRDVTPPIVPIANPVPPLPHSITEQPVDNRQLLTTDEADQDEEHPDPDVSRES